MLARMDDLNPLDMKPSDPRWHIGVREQSIPIRFLKPGMLLPPSRSWTEGYGHLVLAVTDPAPGNLRGNLTLYDYDEDDPSESVKIIPCRREQDSIDLPKIQRDEAPEEHRVPGSSDLRSINWGATGRHPQAGELRRGDILPVRYTHLGFHGPQTVTKISMAWDGRLTVVLRDGHGTRRYTFHPDDEVVFPRRGNEPAQRTSSSERALDRVKALHNCKTAYWLEHPDTKQVFRVIEHPYGRGRWPRDILEFEPLMVHKEGKPIAVRSPDTGDRTYAVDAANMPRIRAAEGDERWPDVPAMTPKHLVDYSRQIQAVTGAYLAQQPGGQA